MVSFSDLPIEKINEKRMCSKAKKDLRNGILLQATDVYVNEMGGRN